METSRPARASEPSRFGVLLHGHRAAAGLSQAELAERAGVSARAISDLERGARRFPYPTTVRRLARALGLRRPERSALLASREIAVVSAAAENGPMPIAFPSHTAGLRDTSIGIASLPARRSSYQPAERSSIVGGGRATAAVVQAAPAQFGPEGIGEQLRRLRIEAGLTQDSLAERAGVSARTVSDLERGVRRFPYRETGRRLADALGLEGQQRAVFHAGPRLERLVPRSSTTDGRPPPLVSPSQLPRRHTLPHELSSFIGRQSELGELRKLLSGTRSLTLTGPGGIGKTRLALHVARASADDDACEVVLVELGALADAALLPRTVAASLGLRERSGRQDLAILIEYFGARPALLVLDTCEHLVQACAELAESLLRECPGLRLLTTSRELLGVPGETAWPVPSLSLPRHGSTELGPADQSAAVRLFVERARGTAPGFGVTTQNAGAVAEICTRLDGIPLAIELAAARVNLLGLDGITARLDTSLRLLTGGKRNAPTRQQTLRATIEWSYQLLPERERRLFRRLAVFAGGWTLAAAERTCAGEGIDPDEVVDLLGRLVDKSLVIAQPGPDGLSVRYRMLDTLRQYATERLQRDDSQQVTRRQHAHVFLALAEQAEPALLGAQAAVWQHQLASENDNLRAALRWLVDNAEIEEGQRLGGALADFWLKGGMFQEGRSWLAELLTATPVANQRAELRGKLLTGAGTLASFQGEYPAAQIALEESVGLWREAETSGELARALHRLGEVAWWHGDYDRARVLSERAVRVSQVVGDRLTESASLLIIGASAFDTCDLAGARTAGEQSLAIALDGGYMGAAATCRLLLGRLSYHRQDFTRAIEQFEQATALFRAWGFPWGVARGKMHMGRIALDQDDRARARALFEESLTLAHSVSAGTRVLGSLEGIAQLEALDGRPERALRLMGAAAGLCEVFGAAVGSLDRAQSERRLAAIRAALPDARADAAYAAGFGLSIGEAIEEALANTGRAPSAER